MSVRWESDVKVHAGFSVAGRDVTHGACIRSRTVHYGTTVRDEVQYRGLAIDTCTRQVGHVCFLHSHCSMHSLWKRCVQCSSWVLAPFFFIASWQIRHNLLSSFRDTVRSLLPRDSVISGMVLMRVSGTVVLGRPVSSEEVRRALGWGRTSDHSSLVLRWLGLGAIVAAWSLLSFIAFNCDTVGSDPRRSTCTLEGRLKLLFLSLEWPPSAPWPQ